MPLCNTDIEISENIACKRLRTCTLTTCVKARWIVTYSLSKRSVAKEGGVSTNFHMTGIMSPTTGFICRKIVYPKCLRTSGWRANLI